MEVPNIEGMTIQEATKALKEKNLELQIENEPEDLDKKTTVINEQLPKQGITIYEGTRVFVKVTI